MKYLLLLFSGITAFSGLMSSLSNGSDPLSFVLISSIFLLLFMVFGKKLAIFFNRIGSIDPRERNPDDYEKNYKKYNYRNFVTLEDKIKK